MEYILLEWSHDMEDEPIMVYSEIDNQYYEVRKIEIYRNGSILKCDEKMINSEIVLADVPFPDDIEEINQDAQFNAKYIGKNEFESLWNKK